jgi:hypothetical protein
MPPITIGDPVGAAAVEPAEPVAAVEAVEPAAPVEDWLPAVVGLLDDDLLLDEQAASASAAAATQRTRLNRRKSVIFPPESVGVVPLWRSEWQLLPY